MNQKQVFPQLAAVLCCFKVGTHEGTSRRDLFQGLVRCRVYTMGQVAGTSPLKGLHAGTCYTSEQQNLGRFH